MKTHRHFLRAFTLIELIVVIAIVITLSIVGFVSYNSYVRDARNATRDSQLTQLATSIERFIFNNGVAPKCHTATNKICYFVDQGAYVGAKATGPHAVSGGTAGLTKPAAEGILTGDWSKLNMKVRAEDPRGAYYVYAAVGDKYAILATAETEGGGYSTIVKGSASYEKSGTTDVIAAHLAPSAPGLVVNGLQVVNNAISSPAVMAPVTSHGYASLSSGTTAIPYSLP